MVLWASANFCHSLSPSLFWRPLSRWFYVILLHHVFLSSNCSEENICVKLHKVFTGEIPVLSPNQQRQSTVSTTIHPFFINHRPAEEKNVASKIKAMSVYGAAAVDSALIVWICRSGVVLIVDLCHVDELSVVKSLVQLTLTVARLHGSAVELCRDIARDLHICVGDIDQVHAPVVYTSIRDVTDSESDRIQHFFQNPSDTWNPIMTDLKILFRSNSTVIFDWWRDLLLSLLF